MRLPEWIKTKAPLSVHATKQMLRENKLSTVCEEAGCPNMGVCFAKPTAAFMILGSKCTRNCGFCSVESSSPGPLDRSEPERVAAAAREMELKYVVITSVTRDDLPDGGASHFEKTVLAVKKLLPYAGVEVLTPDFRGDKEALKKVIGSGPDVFNHNIETVPALYSSVRPQADYEQSLNVLRNARQMSSDVKIKSGFMVGLGETFEEVVLLMEDLRSAKCDYLTIGQYLRPTKRNLPVVEYVRPEIFDEYRDIAISKGFRGVASAPLVRSSMNAEEMFKER